MEEENYRISLKNELIRKSIHLASSVVPISYFFLSREFLIIVLLVMVVAGIIIDIARNQNEGFRNLYLKFIGPILRKHEFKRTLLPFTGATYVVTAFLICVIIFPKQLAITSMLILSISDSLAAIVGRSFGKFHIREKTLEGSLAFFVSGTLIVLLTPKITNSIYEYYVGIVSVLLTTIFELAPIKIDDNIAIPVFFGVIYVVLLNLV